MTRDADRLLRQAVHDLAAEARPSTDLAAVAVRQGRRIRMRRRAGGVATALLAVAVIAAPFVWLRPGADPRPVAEPPPAQVGAAPRPTPTPTLWQPGAEPRPTADWLAAPLALPAGWTVIGATTTGKSGRGYLLDGADGRYLETTGKYDEVWASPTGDLAAVRAYNRPNETGLLEVPGGTVRWARTGPQTLPPQWSPDGSRLLLTLVDRERGAVISFGILDRDLRFRHYAVKTSTPACPDSCRFTWLPNGKEVALPQPDLTAGRPEDAPPPHSGLQVFAVGSPAPNRTVPARGTVSGPAAWSPNGRFVVVDGEQTPQLVDVATGSVLRELPSADVHWVDDARLLYLEPGRPLAPATPGTAAPERTLDAVLVDLRGTELERRPLPEELGAIPNITLGPLPKGW
ncbi:hypothetical protein [Plantactinospora sp. CA-290183]|uniref:hypothetical protein n=1 Tax=Plantactinospora sp. CA-290183 TaxID=3240006 RepID=UPI003D8C84E7